MSALPVSFEPAAWSRVRRFLARRVPRDMIDDVSQSVACEMWASRDRAETPGFVYGVARNEAFDARRRAARGSHEPLDHEATEGTSNHMAEASFARAELAEVIDYVEKKPRLVDPLRWLVAEHAGESFEEIGVREGVAPATIRQRVSRLRRELRHVFAAATIVVLAFGGIGAIHSASETITKESSANDPSVSVISIANGRWRIESIASQGPEHEVARGAVIELRGGDGTISIAGATTPFRVERAADGDTLVMREHRERMTVRKLSEERAIVTIGGAAVTIARIR
jgi:RNA polymerase sigma factor (sigma-70 family)